MNGCEDDFLRGMMFHRMRKVADSFCRTTALAAAALVLKLGVAETRKRWQELSQLESGRSETPRGQNRPIAWCWRWLWYFTKCADGRAAGSARGYIYEDSIQSEYCARASSFNA